MNNSHKHIPQRPIGEEEDELLEQLWEQLPDDKEAVGDFADVQRRILLQRRKRIRLVTGLCSGMAALIAGAIFLLWPSPTPEEPAVYAQLQQMGVKVEHPEVTLTTDDHRSIALDDAARMVAADDSMALHTAQGKEMALAPARTLKLEVPAGKTFKMILADGTQVWLNASSSLEYPASFEGKNERRVKLSGEAFFEVKHDARHPFLVELGQQETIRVLGTSFNVNAYPENKEHVTTLATGRISYRTGMAGDEVVLHPNQQVQLDCNSGHTKMNTVDAAEYAAWRNGIIFFENEKLPALARRLSRIYGIEIKVSPHLKDYSFSGRIGFERGIDYITRLMGETTGISCKVENGIIILK